MRENVDQNNSEYGHFLRSVNLKDIIGVVVYHWGCSNDRNIRSWPAVLKKTAVAIFNFTIQRLIFFNYYDMLIIIEETTYLSYNEDFQIEQQR